jgi:hypothetical protein
MGDVMDEVGFSGRSDRSGRGVRSASACLRAGRAGLSYPSFPRIPVDLVFQDFGLISGGASPRRRDVNVTAPLFSQTSFTG